MIPYFPLAGGLLSGAYRRDEPPEPGSRGAIRPTFKTWTSRRNWDVQEALARFAVDRGWTLPQMSIAWLLTRAMMATVIAGADRPEHIKENVKALSVKFSEADLREIDEITLVEEDRTLAPIYGNRRGRPS
jgi:aryl-alcohol dehydrogenase-like predicted oxidoreductase